MMISVRRWFEIFVYPNLDLTPSRAELNVFLDDKLDELKARNLYMLMVEHLVDCLDEVENEI